MQRNLIAIALAIAAPAFFGSVAFAGDHKSRRSYAPRIERDCTPLNGFYGYYGNPWCDTGSYRLEDIWIRERLARERRFNTSR